jgi:hypothetical protein
VSALSSFELASAVEVDTASTTARSNFPITMLPILAQVPTLGD